MHPPLITLTRTYRRTYARIWMRWSASFPPMRMGEELFLRFPAFHGPWMTHLRSSTRRAGYEAVSQLVRFWFLEWWLAFDVHKRRECMHACSRYMPTCSYAASLNICCTSRSCVWNLYPCLSFVGRMKRHYQHSVYSLDDGSISSFDEWVFRVALQKRGNEKIQLLSAPFA